MRTFDSNRTLKNVSDFSAKLAVSTRENARQDALKILDNLPFSKTGEENSVEVQRRYRSGFDATLPDLKAKS